MPFWPLSIANVCLCVHVQQCGSRMLKTFTISLKERELVKGPWEPIDVEPQASLLQAVPLPLGGVVVVGADTISHHHQNSKVGLCSSLVVELGSSKCYKKFHEWHYLCDINGGM